MKRISIIDYEMSNLFSIKNAIRTLGYQPLVTKNKNKIINSDILILPGVGSFPVAIRKLRSLELVEPILDFVKSKKKIIGICLGMQLMFEISYEFKKNNGLGLLKGSIENLNNYKKNIITPHVGWNKIIFNTSSKINKFKKYNKKYFYFVHSYFAVTNKQRKIVMYTNYNGIKIPAIVAEDNIIAFQFHPEKSGKLGLSVLKEALKT